MGVSLLLNDASLDWWLCTVTCIGVIVFGMVMISKPHWWGTKYFGESGERVNLSALARIARAFGVLSIASGVYFLIQCMDLLS